MGDVVLCGSQNFNRVALMPRASKLDGLLPISTAFPGRDCPRCILFDRHSLKCDAGSRPQLHSSPLLQETTCPFSLQPPHLHQHFCFFWFNPSSPSRFCRGLADPPQCGPHVSFFFRPCCSLDTSIPIGLPPGHTPAARAPYTLRSLRCPAQCCPSSRTPAGNHRVTMTPP